MRIFYSVFVCMIFLFTASQANFNKTLVWLKVETLLMKSIDGNVTFSDLKDCLSLAGSLLMDHNCTLAAQARRLAAAEASGSRSEYASAMFESFYGSKEEESLRRQRRGTNGKTGALTLMSAVWEFVQLEYFLAYYRRRQRRLKAKGRHRRFVPAATGLLKDIDIEVASHISVGNGGGDGAEGGDGGGGGEGGDGGDGEPVPEQPLYEHFVLGLHCGFGLVLPDSGHVHPLRRHFHLLPVRLQSVRYALVWSQAWRGGRGGRGGGGGGRTVALFPRCLNLLENFIKEI